MPKVRKTAAHRKVQSGQLRAKASASAYATRVDEGVAGEIDRAVTEHSRIREEILAKIERRLLEPREERVTRRK